jgi:hypothetical protein
MHKASVFIQLTNLVEMYHLINFGFKKTFIFTGV